MEAASFKQTVKVKVATQLRLELTVAGPCVDHSAAMCLSSCLLYNLRHVIKPHCCPKHFCLLFLLPFAISSAQLPTSLLAVLYSVLMSLVATIGLHG